MTVHLLHDPSGSPELREAACRLHRPDAGTLVVAVPPNVKRALLLYETILSRLGKDDDDRAGTGRANSHAAIYAHAWLAGHQIKRVVLIDATFSLPSILADVIQSCVANGLDVTVLADGPLPSSFDRMILPWVTDAVDETHIADLTAALPPAPPSPTPIGGESGLSVPETDFLTFRADARRRLTSEHFAAVDDVYTRTLHHLLSEPFDDEKRTAQAIHDQLIKHADQAMQITVVRAAQVAAFRNGRHLKVNIPGVLRAAGPAAAIQHLGHDHWATILSASRPAIACIVVLLAAGYTPAEMHDVPRSAVADDGATVNGYEIPHAARPAVLAQHYVHRAFGHGPSTPFLQDSARRRVRNVREHINEYGQSIGVSLKVTFDQKPGTDWRRRYGVTLTSLEAVA